MSRLSKKFKVPDELANLYDFANSLDVRHFMHHGMQHPQADELAGPRELGAWMSQRGLLFTSAKITPAMFEAALQLRSCVRDYLQSDPADRGKDREAVRALNKASKLFPLLVEARDDRAMVLRPARGDALAGLSAVITELYDGSINGTTDRLKMCASEECRRGFFHPSEPAPKRRCTSRLCRNRIETPAYPDRRRGLAVIFAGVTFE